MIAYFDCFSGISGDMIVGAFLDAGVPFDWLRDELRRLPLEGYGLSVEDVQRGGIRGKKFLVSVEVEQVERRLGDIKEIIGSSTLSDDVKGLSIKVFERLAEAEAKVHRVGVDDIHFHEVGGVDSIIDIVAASLSLFYLKIEKVCASGLPLSQGTVHSSHGILPLPAPAVAELLKGILVYQTPVKGELVTPTGAAFLATVSKGFGVMPPMKLEAVGYGAGERENEGLPNLLRVLVGEEIAKGTVPKTTHPHLNPPLEGEGKPPLHQGEGWGEGWVSVESGLSQVDLETDSVTVIEANIDDMNPEVYGFVMDRLFDGGALDVTLTPVYMKKGRPGTLLQVICEAGMEKEMADIMLKETSTIGVRFYRADRLKLPRKTIEVQTEFGEVRIKVASSPWGEKGQPEYDDCKKIAMETGVPILEVYAEATKEFDLKTANHRGHRDKA